MTQDQQDQARDPGYARGDVVADDETDEFANEQSSRGPGSRRWPRLFAARSRTGPIRTRWLRSQVAHDQPVSERPVSDLPTPDQTMTEPVRPWARTRGPE